MLVTVRLFARLRELAGASEIAREVPEGATAHALWTDLAREFPGFAGYERSISCAVNEEYAPLATVLQPGDDVAFLPPVSGG